MTKILIESSFLSSSLGHQIERGMFFEGWYFKMAFANDSRMFAVIPGILINDEQREAFLMVAYNNISHYFSFPFQSFHPSGIDEEFRVTIDDQSDRNRQRKGQFSVHQIQLDMKPNENDDATESIRMNLNISGRVYPENLSWIFPETMGPFGWLNFLQCYHHVLSTRHLIEGNIQIGEDHPTNVKGIGYIEKDWGQMFPSMWIWGQANQWVTSSTTDASLFFSFAIIPTGFGIDKPGFLILFEYEKQFYRFNTFLLSIVHQLQVNNQTNTMSFTVYDALFQHKLQVTAHFLNINGGAVLYGPRNGRMEKFVREMLDRDAYFDVRLSRMELTELKINSDDLFQQHGYREHLLFEGQANNVALEINGNVSWLTEQFDQVHGNVYPWQFSFTRLLLEYYQVVFLLLGTISIGFVVIRVFRS